MTETLFPLDDRQQRLLAGEAVVVNVGKGRDPLAAWAIERGLRGRALGCWCWPQPCHGDVLCELVNRR